MDAKLFYELVLDNLIYGVYILDDAGNYVYANSAYIDWLGIPKSKLLSMNVHDFLKNDQIDLCCVGRGHDPADQPIACFRQIFV